MPWVFNMMSSVCVEKEQLNRNIIHSLHLSNATAFSVGNRVDDPLQKVGRSSPVVACKTPRRHCHGVAGGRYGSGGGQWGSGSHINTVVGEMDYLVHSRLLFRQN